MATVPSIPALAVGNTLSAAHMEALRDAVNFLLGSGANARPLAVVRQTVAQTIPTGAWTALTFGAEDLDTDGMHSTTTNTSRLTAVTAGYYDVRAYAHWTGGAVDTRRLLGLRKNGTGTTAPSAGWFETAFRTGSVSTATSWTIYLNAGDYVESVAFQDSGADLSPSVASAAQQPVLQAFWLKA